MFALHRLVPLTSPLPRGDSRWAKQKLELSGHYTQATFSYHLEIQPSFMVLPPVQLRYTPSAPSAISGW